MKRFDLNLRWCRVAALASILLMPVSACSKEEAGSGAADAPEQPWSHAGYGEGWWSNWKVDKIDFTVGTRFELETIHKDGSRQTSAWVVRSIKPSMRGGFSVGLAGSSLSYSSELPPRLPYPLFARTEKLVSVKTPAGTFLAGRLWSSGGRDIVYETDTWVVADIPVPVQTWERPVTAKHLYDPPADGTVPPGTYLQRLVRIQKP